MYKSMKIQTLLGAALMAGSLASCSVEEQEIPASEQYARQFYKTFGVNGSTEGFNVVEQKSVHVKSSKPTHVKIYELQAGEYRLAADYENVTDQTITFDGVKKDTTPFLVSCDDNMFCAQNGGTVTYTPQSGSLLKSSAIPSEYSSIVKQNTNYTTITCNSNDETFKTLAENDGKDNHSTFTVATNHYVPVTKGSSFTVYPAYWNSKKKHTVGIYYTDGSSIKTIAVYSDKDGDELQFKVNDTYTPTVKDAEDCWNYGEAGKVTYSDHFSFQAKGYTVTADKDVAAGIYVEVGGKKYYSNAVMNGGVSYFAYKTLQEGGEGYTYLMFDDPSDNGGEGDRDFNDFVMYIGQTLAATSQGTIGWTVACEDLGGTFDYDFNDVVFQVYYVSGQDWIRIVPVAAGGTLPAYLYYTRNKKEYPISLEWHKHFGSTTDTYTSSDMINTCYGGKDYERSIYPIYVTTGNKNFSMTEYTEEFDNAGKFTLKVQRADGQVESINAPGTAKEPQVLVLPLDWRWPKELVRINSIYPSFGQWGDGYSTGQWVGTIQNADQLTEEGFYSHVTGRKSYEPKTE